MIRLIILVVLLAGLSTGEGEENGRKGNQLYRNGEYEQASEAYRAGVEVSGEESGSITSKLYNNLGASLFRMEQWSDAEASFSRSMALSTDSFDKTRAAYNAGNAAVSLQKMEESLAYYREALLADPENADARYNYEYVKRQLEKQEQQSQPDSNENQEEDSSGGENNDEQEQQQNPEQNQDSENESQEQQQQPEQRESQMSKEQAEQILRAMENDEKQLLQQVRKRPTQRTQVEKDW